MMRLVQCDKRPCQGAMHQTGEIWLVNDSEAKDLVIGASTLIGSAAFDALPARRDLPTNHPMYDKKALFNVPSGHPDIIVRESGSIETSTGEI